MRAGRKTSKVILALCLLTEQKIRSILFLFMSCAAECVAFDLLLYYADPPEASERPSRLGERRTLLASWPLGGMMAESCIIL